MGLWFRSRRLKEGLASKPTLQMFLLRASFFPVLNLNFLQLAKTPLLIDLDTHLPSHYIRPTIGSYDCNNMM